MQYEFGPFRLDVETFVLLRGQEAISITPKALQTLRVLVESSGRLISKDELLTSVWDDASVDEANLAQNIFALRKALGEKPRDHHFIVTIPGKGYRFVAEVKACGPSLARYELSAPTVSSDVIPSRVTRARGFALFALVVGLGAVTFTLQRKQDTVTDYPEVSLTSYLGTVLCPSFAPEGERIAFSWDGENQDNFDIYVKRIGPGAPVRLTTNPRPDLSPAWSPNGRTIAFLRLPSNGKAEVWLIPSDADGPERLIAQVTAPDEVFSRMRCLSWSPDGEWLVVPDRTSANVDASIGLSLVSTRTGEKRRLTWPPR
jgi:DNA-binding winged helix-turn-helix (wHTH) protein